MDDEKIEDWYVNMKIYNYFPCVTGGSVVYCAEECNFRKELRQWK